MKTNDNKNRYTIIYVHNNDGTSKKFKIHKLVAYLFIKNIDNKKFVNHINNIRNNNYFKNLR